ncbi:uncharacterized protein VTP21DRAFT_10431 [Calcarisporiella thermophila]|uniref:uncharacterized protein n=1 Tax=Calcarisporiella thermophila TaxID=911321 RepID=UPI00374221FD
MTYRVGIIVGSTRPTRVGREIANAIYNLITPYHGLDYEVIDLLEWNLPIFNEPDLPSNGVYVYDLTKRWSKKISSKDAFIFVTPQYNWGYPASIKNAIDYLYSEWNNKPAMIISYAYQGGGKAAAQLRQVLEGIGMKPVDTMPGIHIGSLSLKGADQLVGEYKNDILNGIDQIIEYAQLNSTEAK